MARAIGLAAGVLLASSLFCAMANATESDRKGMAPGPQAGPLKLALVLETAEAPGARLAARVGQAASVGARGPSSRMLLTSDGSKLGYAVSREVRLGLGYDYVTGEDLDFEVAETGSLDDDYTSHRVMVRAHVQF